MKNIESKVARRSFCKSSVVIFCSSMMSSKKLKSAPSNSLNIPLGFDNFSIRAMGWKAPRLLEYAKDQKVDSVLFSDLEVYDSLETSYLNEVKTEADKQRIVLHAGTGSICPTSQSFKEKYGNAEEHLRLLIRVAREVGSNVARCYLGNMKDRMGQGGIQQHIDSTIRVLKKVREYALDSDVKIALENHAGDLHSRELIELIERAGPDFVGATIDSGNATWTMEDPVETLRNLSPYAVSSGIRDSMVWENKKGVTVQWTAMGDGCTDLKKFTSEWKKLCPSLPMQLETISGFAKDFAILEKDFWQPYSGILAEDLSRFLLLAKKGIVLKPFKPAASKNRKAALQEYQLFQLEKSLKFCKDQLGLGIK